MRGRRPCLVVGLILGALAGCRSLPANRDVYPASGKLLLNGHPVRWATVHLEPKDPAIGNEAEGLVGSDGTFRIRTYSNRGPDGAVPGEYSVWIEPYSKAKNGKIKGAVSPTPIPKKYQNTSTSGLTVTIEPEDNELKFELK